MGTTVSSLLGAMLKEDGTINNAPVAALGGVTRPTLAVAEVDLDGVSFGAVVNALASLSNANLLSTPSIVTLDNTEAKIVVGKKSLSARAHSPQRAMGQTTRSPPLPAKT